MLPNSGYYQAEIEHVRVFSRRTGITDGRVDAVLRGWGALHKFPNGIELPRKSAWEGTFAAPQTYISDWRPTKPSDNLGSARWVMDMYTPLQIPSSILNALIASGAWAEAQDVPEWLEGYYGGLIYEAIHGDKPDDIPQELSRG